MTKFAIAPIKPVEQPVVVSLLQLPEGEVDIKVGEYYPARIKNNGVLYLYSDIPGSTGIKTKDGNIVLEIEE